MQTKTYYFCQGSVRGRCPHNHSTVTGALRCLEADKAGCHSQGGYSDRLVWRKEPGKAVEAMGRNEEEVYL